MAARETYFPEATSTTNNAPQLEQLDKGEIPRHARQQLHDAKRNNSETRTNAALATDAWTLIDDEVGDTFHATSEFVQYLIDQGLDHSVDFMAEFDRWQTRDTHGSAEVSMHLEANTSDSAVSYGWQQSPVPAIYDDFTVRYREGAAEGMEPDEDLETSGISACTRHVTETAEQLVLGEESLEMQINDGQDIADLKGIMTHDKIPDEHAGTNWSDDAGTARDDVRSARAVLKNDMNVRAGNVGYDLFVGTEWYDALDDYNLDIEGRETMRDSVESLANINQVRELDFLDPESGFLMRPTEDVMQLGVANDIQPLQWDGPFSENWTVFGSMYPRIKVTRRGQVGIVTLRAP